MLKPVNRDTHVSVKQGWHGMSTVETTITKDNCKINYPLEKQRLSLPNRYLTDSYHVVSLDDGLPIGKAVGEGYKIVSNTRMLDAIEKSLEGTDHRIHSVGTFKDRSAVFVSVELSKEFLAGGRLTESVLNFIWGHGGLFSVTANACINVISCYNSLKRALTYKSKDFRVDFRHSGNVDEKIDNMGEAVEAFYGVTAEFTRAMDELAGQNCSEARARAIFTGFLSDSDTKLATRTVNRVDDLTKLFHTGKGNNGETMADVFNAITDLFSHSARKKDDKNMSSDAIWKQFESSEIGSGSRYKENAYDLFTGKTIPTIGNLLDVENRGINLMRNNSAVAVA